MADAYTGVIPIVPTIFHDDETLDLPGLRRVVDFVVDSGVDAMCVLANYSEQFSLADDERDQVLDCVVEHNAGRVPIVVTTSHYSAHVAAARSRRAQQVGAEMVMLMPPFFGATMAVPERLVVDYFTTVAAAIDIPIMLQDAPMSTTPMSASLMVRLAQEVPLVRYAKVEVAGAAEKIRTLNATLDGTPMNLFDGEESITLVPDLDAGAVGTMPSAMVPDLLADIVHTYRGGDRHKAVDAWEALLPLIHFENRQCGLRAQKILMAEGGIIASERTRAPLPPVSPETRRGLVDLATRRSPLVLRWAS